MKKIILVALLIMVLLSACVGEKDVNHTPNTSVTVLARNDGWIVGYRIVDYDAGVVCYSIGDEGTSCVLFSETKLGE